MKKPVLWFLFLMACAIGLLSQAKDIQPKANDQQKLELRTKQVTLYKSKEVLEQTDQFRAFQYNQNDLNQSALRIQREIGCVPPKWQFTQDLECITVPEPAKPEKK